MNPTTINPIVAEKKNLGDGIMKGKTKKVSGTVEAKKVQDIAPMTEPEKVLRAELEQTMNSAQIKTEDGFKDYTLAVYGIQRGKLYRESHATFAAYFKEKYDISRSHAHRVARQGEILTDVSPIGDIGAKLTSDAHLRPLMKLDKAQILAAMEMVKNWFKMAKPKSLSPKLVQSVVTFRHPPEKSNAIESKVHLTLEKVKALVKDAKEQLPNTKEVNKVVQNLEKKVKALDNPRASTGISWTYATWNPLQGCTRHSAGCDHCYAAKSMATRLADVYPGLAVAKTVKGKTVYHFTGKILLLPEELGTPLNDRIPKLWFVNSMSDLFHKDVPNEFINLVFDVMEKAHWHQFQVLTKRPERMAIYTQKRYAEKEPPVHIWLGTSTENQETFDKRYPELLKVKTAVPWLSCEPLLGPIAMSKMEGIKWVVVGGESGSDRPMDKAWATSIRDQCEKAGVPFFFKQWGEYNEAGEKKKEVKDRNKPPTLDGVIHDDFPVTKDPSETVKPEKAPKKNVVETELVAA